MNPAKMNTKLSRCITPKCGSPSRPVSTHQRWPASCPKRLTPGNFVPSQPGKSAVDLFKALKTGEIKAVWIACTNPAQSLPNQAAVREALQAADYVVLQEAYGNTDTADYADLLLPASGWGEKHGTVTNSERCITRVLPFSASIIKPASS